ncbi:hypothetical protein [Rufibacter sp. XAAS-G3-1]|uniref:hypothetical protein n=1 Tax=Rufibacter sp. XAAS-G3-1 TaxID=2729134 RepID=UPI0015E6C4EF|nr:hypothetical protein [Rufibacter sp. XAAS-G3-1]
MKNYYPSQAINNPEFLEEDFSAKLMTILQSEVYERGEAIEDVLSVATTYKEVLGQSPELKESKNADQIFWHLDSLIQEALNMMHNPKNDLFLYLRALFAFKNSIQSNFEFQNIPVA